MDVDGAVGNLQMFHQAPGEVNVRLLAVGHQHADDILPPVGRHSQGRHGGAVLAAGDADNRRLAVARLHSLVHPFQQARKLHLGVKFHKKRLPTIIMVYCTANSEKMQCIFPNRRKSPQPDS